MKSSQNVVRFDAFKRSHIPPKVFAPKLTDLSFVKQGRKRGDGYRCWVVEPSGNYGADCKTGNALALEYLKFVTKAAFPLQWIVFEMPREAERTGIEVGFLGVVTRAAAFGASVAGDHLPELLNPDNQVCDEIEAPASQAGVLSVIICRGSRKAAIFFLHGGSDGVRPLATTGGENDTSFFAESTCRAVYGRNWIYGFPDYGCHWRVLKPRGESHH